MRGIRLWWVCAMAAAFGALPAGANQTENLDLGGNISLELVRIEAGSFKMGSPANETGRRADEEQVEVGIKQPFWIGSRPVTRGQYSRFVQESGYRTEAELGTSGGFGFDGKALVQNRKYTWRNPGFAQTDDHPVVIVTYGDAQAFTAWLSRRSRRRISLPTEAQWEYACRAGTSGRFYNGDGDQDADKIAWSKASAGAGTKAVGQKEPNAWGLYDMSGNVYQWCQDIYGPYRPGAAVQGPMDKPRNVLRGGSWLKGLDDVRSAARYRAAPGSRNADNGFRVVAAVTENDLPLEKAAGPGLAVATGQAANDGAASPPIQSPPAASHTAVDHTSRGYSTEGSFGGSMSLLLPCGFVVVAAIVVLLVVVKMIRGVATGIASGMPATMHRPMRTRLTSDGFWVDTSDFSDGDIVTFTYQGDGGAVESQFTVESASAEQFIYTGTPPRNPPLLERVVQGDSYSDQMSVLPTTMPVERNDTPVRHSSGFGGFPSAY